MYYFYFNIKYATIMTIITIMKERFIINFIPVLSRNKTLNIIKLIVKPITNIVIASTTFIIIKKMKPSTTNTFDIMANPLSILGLIIKNTCFLFQYASMLLKFITNQHPLGERILLCKKRAVLI